MKLFGQKMSAAIKLLTVLPATLKIAWLLLLFGMVAMATGYFTHTPWQSYLGLICLIVGYVIAILDMVNRRRHRGDAAGFYVGATVAPLIALIILAFVALLGAIVLAVQSMIHGFSGSHAIRLLHFLGIVFAFLVVSGIPGFALRPSPNTKTEQDGAGQPATRSESK
jgi:hypothetical protein